MKKNIHNISFRKKIILIFTVTFLFSIGSASLMYYRYMSQDIIKNFQMNSEDVIMQITDTFAIRHKAIANRVRGMLTNHTFVIAMGDYLSNPSNANTTKALGVASDFLRDLESGEPLISSSYIYTNRGEFDDFIRMRNWEFSFKDSLLYEPYKDRSANGIQNFPAMKDLIFQGEEMVIPQVWRFSVEGYTGKQYLVVQLKQKEVESILSGKYQFFDKMVVLDTKGRLIAGSEKLDKAQLLELSKNHTEEVFSSDYIYQDEEFLVTSGKIEGMGWQIYGLRSKKSLLSSLEDVKNMLLKIALGLSFISMLIIVWMSHQMTDGLRRLEKRMSYVRNGDLNTRFFYPYHDEIGSLAKSFNFMIGEIQSLVKKQEETIEELKLERDRVAEMQKQKRKAELKALQAQINPHFLYNTLNAITWQAIDQGAEEVSILSNSLGKFFRLSLSKGAEVISLREELEHVSSYLDIQSIRYHSRIQYEIRVPKEWYMHKIIKLVLQPLAENSIYHGIKEKGGSGKIIISAEETVVDGVQMLSVSVWDDGAGISKEKLEVINNSLLSGEIDRKEGYGIYNVNERIKLYYGNAYGLRYESIEGEWAKAILMIPLEEAEEETTGE